MAQQLRKGRPPLPESDDPKVQKKREQRNASQKRKYLENKEKFLSKSKTQYEIQKGDKHFTAEFVKFFEYKHKRIYDKFVKEFYDSQREYPADVVEPIDEKSEDIYTEESLSKKSGKELVEICKKLHLPSSKQKKAVMVKRILESVE